MTYYRSKVEIPDSIREFLEAFEEVGTLRIESSGEATFEFEADDLWDAAEIVRGAKESARGSTWALEPEISKPTVVA